jgi:hypothetical protein
MELFLILDFISAQIGNARRKLLDSMPSSFDRLVRGEHSPDYLHRRVHLQFLLRELMLY